VSLELKLSRIGKKREIRGYFRGGGGFEIGSTSSLQVGFDPPSVGINWVCFRRVCKGVDFHNPLLILYLRSFGHLVNWVCFGFVLALNWVCIGFELALFLRPL
jgi:hypothetical protein